MKIRPIKTEQQYFEALEQLELIFDAKENTPEGDEAEILSLLIDTFENKHYQIEALDPIEAIRIRMEEMNLKQKDMVEIIGSKSKTSEVLNRKKRLTLDMIRNLQEKLNLSASLLITTYPINN